MINFLNTKTVQLLAVRGVALFPREINLAMSSISDLGVLFKGCPFFLAFLLKINYCLELPLSFLL